ncbi:MAG: LysE family translocator [Bacteroidetes bacterium]|nr:LysE family translocator [Bacteroidota bacterium]
MDPLLLLSFLSASILLVLMPGPDIIYVLTESITKGAKTGRTIAFGLVSGILIHTTLAATGVSLLIYRSNAVFKGVKYAGAAYLFYLAYLSLKEQPIQIDATNISKNENSDPNYIFIKLYRKGFLMNVLNPKVSVFFIAFLPQFVSPEGFPPIIQMMIMGVIFIIQAFLIFSLVAALSGRISRFLQNEKYWIYSKWIKAVVLFLIGLSLVLY